MQINFLTKIFGIKDLSTENVNEKNKVETFLNLFFNSIGKIDGSSQKKSEEQILFSLDEKKVDSEISQIESFQTQNLNNFYFPQEKIIVEKNVSGSESKISEINIDESIIQTETKKLENIVTKVFGEEVNETKPNLEKIKISEIVSDVFEDTTNEVKLNLEKSEVKMEPKILEEKVIEEKTVENKFDIAELDSKESEVKVEVSTDDENLSKNKSQNETSEDKNLKPQDKNFGKSEFVNSNITNTDFTNSSEKIILKTQNQFTQTQTPTYSSVLNEEWTKQTVENIGKSIDATFKMQNHDAEIHLKLHPENLGEIVLDVKSENGILSTSIKVSSSEVKNALESNLLVLQDALSSRGIEMKKIEIFENEFNNQKNNSQENQFQDQSQQDEHFDEKRQEKFIRYFGYNTIEKTI